MAAEQGRGMAAGGMPALNIERIYRTTVPAEELARALADHFRVQEFEAQVSAPATTAAHRCGAAGRSLQLGWPSGGLLVTLAPRPRAPTPGQRRSTGP
jgi:hypothetical protein